MSRSRRVPVPFKPDGDHPIVGVDDRSGKAQFAGDTLPPLIGGFLFGDRDLGKVAHEPGRVVFCDRAELGVDGIVARGS